MDAQKALVATKTFWGGLIAMIPAIAQVAQTLQVNIALIPSPRAQAIAAALGGALAIYGRFSAKTKVTSVLPTKS